MSEKIYLVGGAVRDFLLNRQISDYDYVVVGSNESKWDNDPTAKRRGKDFPVYVKNGCEYALARTERSTGSKYTDFSIQTEGVTLEQDLSRRDFTFNAIAFDCETNQFIDPYGGINDLKCGIIRCVDTRSFSDDPIRILRAARFSARYGFEIEEQTKQLMSLYDLSDMDKNRIMKEFHKSENLNVMLDILQNCSVGYNGKLNNIFNLSNFDGYDWEIGKLLINRMFDMEIHSSKNLIKFIVAFERSDIMGMMDSLQLWSNGHDDVRLLTCLKFLKRLGYEISTQDQLIYNVFVEYKKIVHSIIENQKINKTERIELLKKAKHDAISNVHKR